MPAIKVEKNKDNKQNMLGKTVELAMLLDAYGMLLTERQRQYLSLFYEEDFSLAEIGERFAISRQAVHDTIRHGETQLQEYEAALHLVAKDQERQEIIQELKTLSGHSDRLNELLDRLI